MKKILYFIYIPLIITLISCNKIETEYNHKNDNCIVFLNEAIQIASNLNSETTKAVQKTIGLTESITRGGNTPYFHIITYKEGGFAIISGDKRVSPLMAYSDVSNFSFDESQYPPYLTKWMDNAVYTISLIRENNSSPDPETTSQWNSVPETRATKPFTPDLCQYNGQLFSDFEVTTYECALSTTWGQGLGYNDALDNLGCSSYSNGRPPAGGGVIAVGQLMKFHNYPTTIQWSNMPNNTGSQTTAQFLAQLGEYINIQYDCDGTASTDLGMIRALENYGYSTNYLTYDSELIPNYIIGRKPIIILGTDHAKNAGHAWICDGIKIHVDYRCVDKGFPQLSADRTVRKYLKMNWGGSGKYDAYYADNYFNMNGYLFDTNLKMIIATPIK